MLNTKDNERCVEKMHIQALFSLSMISPQPLFGAEVVWYATLSETLTLIATIRGGANNVDDARER